MHRPAARKVFHRGGSFTRCGDCGATLIRAHEGWVPLPANKQVTWRALRSEDRNFSFAPNGQRARLAFRPSALWRASGRSVTADD